MHSPYWVLAAFAVSCHVPPLSTVPALCWCMSVPNSTGTDGQSLASASEMGSSENTEERLVLCTVTVLIKSLSHKICTVCFSKIQKNRQRVEPGASVQNDPSSLSLFHGPVKRLPGSTPSNHMLQTAASPGLLRFPPEGCAALGVSMASRAPELFVIPSRCWSGTQELRGPLWLTKASADLQTPE